MHLRVIEDVRGAPPPQPIWVLLYLASLTAIRVCTVVTIWGGKLKVITRNPLFCLRISGAANSRHVCSRRKDLNDIQQPARLK